MSNFLTTAGFQSILIRKPLSGVIFIAPYSATALAAITTGAGAANTLDTATISGSHKTLGKITNDGVTFGNSVSRQEAHGFGDVYPARIDVDGQSVNLSWTAMETNVRTIDAWSGVTQVGTGQLAATTKELIVNMPPLPVIRDQRILALFKDNNADGTGEIFMAVYLLRANVIQNGDVTYNFVENGLNYPLQANALNDDVAGAPVRLFMGGPGFQSIFTAMGYS